MFRNIFRAVAKILRRMSRALKKGLMPVAGFIDGLFSSLFGGRAQYEDVEETVQIVDTEVEQEFEADAPAPAPVSLPQLAKTASTHLESGRPYAEIFDLTDPAQASLYAWTQSLDETGRRMLRNVTFSRLASHLDVTSADRCPGLPAYPVAANTNAPAATEAFSFVDINNEQKYGRQPMFV